MELRRVEEAEAALSAYARSAAAGDDAEAMAPRDRALVVKRDDLGQLMLGRHGWEPTRDLRARTSPGCPGPR